MRCLTESRLSFPLAASCRVTLIAAYYPVPPRRDFGNADCSAVLSPAQFSDLIILALQTLKQLSFRTR
jgi:hypothetical protein